MLRLLPKLHTLAVSVDKTDDGEAKVDDRRESRPAAKGDVIIRASSEPVLNANFKANRVLMQSNLCRISGAAQMNGYLPGTIFRSNSYFVVNRRLSIDLFLMLLSGLQKEVVRI